MPVFTHFYKMELIDWNEQAKRFLKSELTRRGVNNDELVSLLSKIGVKETKTSIDSKISRGTFSAAFLLQCLNAIGCRKFESDVLDLLEEPRMIYRSKKNSNDF